MIDIAIIVTLHTQNVSINIEKLVVLIANLTKFLYFY